MALLVGHRFSVVTTLDVPVPLPESSIRAYGFASQLGRMRASGDPVLDLERDPTGNEPAVIAEIKRTVAEDMVVLGCVGMV